MIRHVPEAIYQGNPGPGHYNEIVVLALRLAYSGHFFPSLHWMMVASELSSSTTTVSGSVKKRFYRPELDVLRFLAFFLVFLTHGPRLPESYRFGYLYDRLAGIGVYGLTLFFFLSSFLITELLLQEKERTGRIHLKAFYLRRILRIWPLYFTGILIGIGLSIWHYREFGLSKTELLCFLFFLGYIPGKIKSPVGHLWSISVEELFYAVWPVLSQVSNAILFWLSLSIFPIALFLASFLALRTWYNPFVQFLFFATGYMAAIYLHNKDWRPARPVRLSLFALGMAAWFSASMLYSDLPLRCAEPFAYLFAASGCVLVFLSVLGMQLGSVLRPFVYLGKISYGLYVFHLPWLSILDGIILPRGIQHRVLIEMIGGFLLTVGTAALSYKYLEKPFLHLKAKFEFIRTRNTGGSLEKLPNHLDDGARRRAG